LFERNANVLVLFGKSPFLQPSILLCFFVYRKAKSLAAPNVIQGYRPAVNWTEDTLKSREAIFKKASFFFSPNNLSLKNMAKFQLFMHKQITFFLKNNNLMKKYIA
jgi:hypothetical protein